LVNKLQLNWIPALAAKVVKNEDRLEVDFEGVRYKVAAKAYTTNIIRNKIKNGFGTNNLIEITTFPTLSALFPQELFANATTRELCTKVDNLLANNLEIAAGPYIVACCKKSGHSNEPEFIKGYASVLNVLRSHNIDTSIRIKEHGPVKTMDDVKKVLDVEPGSMIKSILVSIKMDESDSDLCYKNLFLIGVPADRKLDFSKLANLLGVSREVLQMATQMQVEEVAGFTVGSIPPFGLPKNIPIILDLSFLHKNEVWCGTGKLTESIRLTLPELKMLSTPTFYDISKTKEL
jgi:prolyl-tRNA editing enzyme YbaK/EbsC (Cys-tRNA(Pro) deacylase)